MRDKIQLLGLAAVAHYAKELSTISLFLPALVNLVADFPTSYNLSPYCFMHRSQSSRTFLNTLYSLVCTPTCPATTQFQILLPLVNTYLPYIGVLVWLCYAMLSMVLVSDIATD